MSVDVQFAMAGGLNMAAVETGTGFGETVAATDVKFANLNEALAVAGSIIGAKGAELPLSFHFIWHGMAIYCDLVEAAGAVILILEADLGPLPYSVEDGPRRAYLTQLHDPALALPIGAFIVNKQGRFRHRVERPLNGPVTGGNIVTAVVQSLLTARPYYQLARMRDYQLARTRDYQLARVRTGAGAAAAA